MSTLKGTAAAAAKKTGGGFINGYREFILRGNVVDLQEIRDLLAERR